MKTIGLNPRTFPMRQHRGVGIILAILSVLFLLGTGAARRAQAQTFTILHSFSYSDGARPFTSLVRDSAGNLYGTTQGGGSNNWGIVFKLDTSGTLTVLHNFAGGTADGAGPEAGLLMDSSGNLYGTTIFGGTSTDCPLIIGCGAVFKLTPSAASPTGYTETILHIFSYSDGANPISSLVMDTSGYLWGTTWYGGFGPGTVFKVDTNGGSFAVPHSFSGSDGGYPQAGLVMDSSGNLYGTTYYGFSSSGPYGGTVFKLDTYGALTTLHKFAGPPTDGAHSRAGLVVDSSGHLYGTTEEGGAYGSGTVFKLDTSGGGFAVLYSFSGSDGAGPYGGLVRDSAGNLYGTTQFGGTSTNCPGSSTGVPDGCGTVFKLDTSGTLTVLHNFAGGTADGAHPLASLLMDSAGNLYGTTYYGGSLDLGTVFEISTSPQSATQAIVTQVDDLLAQGVINKGQDNSLLKELQKAIDMMNKGKINGAIGNLEDFISEVNDLENSGVLTGAQGSALTSAATSVIQQLQAM